MLDSQEEYRQYFKDAPDKHYKHLMAMLPNFLNPIPIDVELLGSKSKWLTKGLVEDNDHVIVNDIPFIFNVGYDVSVVSDSEWEDKSTYKKEFYSYKLQPFQSKLFHTGIKVATPPNWGFILRERSGMAKEGIQLRGGVVEGTYRGEWMVNLYNSGHSPYVFEEGDRIAQAILIPIFPSVVNVVKSISPSKRGKKGYGSSGK